MTQLQPLDPIANATLPHHAYKNNRLEDAPDPRVDGMNLDTPYQAPKNNGLGDIAELKDLIDSTIRAFLPPLPTSENKEIGSIADLSLTEMAVWVDSMVRGIAPPYKIDGLDGTTDRDIDKIVARFDLPFPNCPPLRKNESLESFLDREAAEMTSWLASMFPNVTPPNKNWREDAPDWLIVAHNEITAQLDSMSIELEQRRQNLYRNVNVTN